MIFDSNPGLAEDKYLELYQKLVRYFVWNQKADAEDLAQETLKRGLSRLQQGCKITTDDPAGYFFGIARNLIRESWRVRHEESLDGQDLRPAFRLFRNLNQSEQLIFLRECLRGLENGDLQLLMAYLEGEGEAWALRIGVTLSTLRCRVHRLRKRLEQMTGTKKIDVCSAGETNCDNSAGKRSPDCALPSRRDGRRRTLSVGRTLPE